METGIFIALLNPSIAFVLATAFLLFWLQQRTRAYMALLAAGYGASGIGFLLQYFELPVGFYATKFLSNLSFAAAGVLIAVAVISRYRRPVPYVGLFLLAGGGLAAFVWFVTVDPSLTWRIYAMNFALGGISLLVAIELRAVPDKTLLDKALLAASLITGINFIARTLLLVGMHGGYDSYEGLYTSPYWTSAMLTHALTSIVLALCLIMAAVSDVLVALRAESHTDPLSGLLNRRGFEERARPLVHGSAAKSAPLSLVLADLDHFKSVNDRHGHAVGDAVIAGFSSLLREAGGASAVTGRTGGEEFAILLPACDLAMARLLAEGLRAALSDGRPPGIPAAVGTVTASFGVASLNAGEDLTALLARADQALYEAKRNGRNRVSQAQTAELRRVAPVSAAGPGIDQTQSAQALAERVRRTLPSAGDV